MKREMTVKLLTDERLVTLDLPCNDSEIDKLVDMVEFEWLRFDSDFDWIDLDDVEIIESLHKLNDIAERSADMSDKEYTQFLAACRFEHCKTIDDVVSCLDSYDEYDFDPEINTYEDYLEAYLQVNDDDMFIGAPESCANEVGRMILTAHGGSLTEYGVMAPASQGLYDRLNESELAEAKELIARVAEHGEYYVCWDPDENERELFFSSTRDDIKNACIGYVRIDFGNGSEFWHKWFGSNEQLNTTQFKKDLELVIESLREDWLKDRSTMKRLADSIPLMDLGDRGTGFRMQTDSHIFFLRCAPQAGDYDCYCYCYDRGLLEQAMGEDMCEEEKIGMEMN